MGQGYGNVVKILPNNGGFVVNVPGRGELHYTVYGTIGVSSDVRVYYQDPVIVVPTKNDRLWLAYKRLTKALYDELVKLDVARFINDGSDGETGSVD
jgi:hypothetical protein